MPTVITLVDGNILAAADVNTSVQNLNQALGTGTAITGYTTGDDLYASATNTLSKRAIGATGDISVVSGGVPTWSGTATKGLYGIRNLVGNTTTTTIVVTADYAVLRNSNHQTKIHTTVSLTIDSAVSGLNGRDQAGAFTAGQDLHWYLISDGTNVRGVLADSGPSTGPDLATVAAFSGYTFWCYGGTLEWNGSSNFIPARLRGDRVWYEAEQQVLTNGTQAAETAVTISGHVPAIAYDYHVRWKIELGSAGATLRVVAGTVYTTIDTDTNSTGFNSGHLDVPNTTNLYYTSPDADDVSLWVLSYTVPNAAG